MNYLATNSTPETKVNRACLTTEQTEYVKGLQAVTDLLEANPQIPAPLMTILGVWISDKDEFLSALKGTGHWMKRSSNGVFTLRQEFGPIKLDLSISQKYICERIVTGTRTVPERPAVPEHEEEIVEWKCPQSLLRDEKGEG